MRIVAGLALLPFFAALTPASAQDLPATKFKIIGGISVTSQYKLLEEPFWTKRLPAASGGKVSGDIQSWNKLGLKGPEVLRLVQRKIADGATAFLGHMAGDIPMNEGVDLAGLSPTFKRFGEVMAAFRPVLAKHYEEKQGLKLLGLWSYQQQILVCKEPMKGLQDLKGRKVRTSGATQADFVKYFGGSGIPLPFGEVQQALVKGVIDCAISGSLGIYQAKWYEGAKFLYPLPITWGALGFAMRLDRWKALPPNMQAFLTAQMGQLEKDIWALNEKEHQMGIDCNTGKTCPRGKPAGLQLGVVSPEDEKLRQDALVKAVLPAWAKRCGAACVAQWNATVGKLVGLTAKAN